ARKPFVLIMRPRRVSIATCDADVQTRSPFESVARTRICSLPSFKRTPRVAYGIAAAASILTVASLRSHDWRATFSIARQESLPSELHPAERWRNPGRTTGVGLYGSTISSV